MGLMIRLETEYGRKIEEATDPTNILHRLLPRYDDPRCKQLKFVDWYGDTVFNRIQIPIVIGELEEIMKTCKDQHEIDLLEGIKGLCEKGREGGDLYIKFYGE